jgi:hypothetical protein
MNYLQVMPTDQPTWGLDLGVVLTISIVLVAVIVLFDKSKTILSRISKRKS